MVQSPQLRLSTFPDSLFNVSIMQLSSKLTDALNEQLGMEFSAFYSYLAMAAYFEADSWGGFAKWMTLQSDEEREHAMKFYTYLIDRGAQVRLPQIPAPAVDFDSPIAVFETSFAQERKVTESIHELYRMAHDSADYATVSFLKWFVDEQVEEEKNVSDMVEKLKRANGNAEALLMLDNLAGKRMPEGEG